MLSFLAFIHEYTVRTETFHSFSEVKVDKALSSSRKETMTAMYTLIYCEHKLPKITLTLMFYCSKVTEAVQTYAF